jgi:hypothetical protein
MNVQDAGVRESLQRRKPASVPLVGIAVCLVLHLSVFAGGVFGDLPQFAGYAHTAATILLIGCAVIRLRSRRISNMAAFGWAVALDLLVVADKLLYSL